MTILQSLDGYYGRIAARGEAEAPGFSREKISFAIVLSPEGGVVDVLDLRVPSGKKLVPRLLEVPAAVKRTAGILPNLLWDKSAYVLGRTAGEGKRTADEHAAFLVLHAKRLAKTGDEGFVALRLFLESWRPERFDAPPFTAEMLDTNLVFRLDGEACFIHQRPAAQALLALQAGGDAPAVPCLVTGLMSSMARLHPTIKGVEGAQSSGAALVSFNREAFTSYGKDQGDNAPTSEAAAFRYGAALNRMLDRDSHNRLRRPLGDATVVFWADASEATGAEAAARAAEDVFALMNDPPASSSEGDAQLEQDAAAAQKVHGLLAAAAEGRPLREMDPRLDEGVRFHVLGLAPNAARLSVRFWMTDAFGAFARRLAQHYADLTIEPRPWRSMPPSISRLLVNTTALQQKFENIPPLLAGEVMRAVLAGTPYPRTLLSAAILRLRAGDDPATGWHAAAIRAVLARHNPKEPPPVSLDREEPNAAYQLGRMFAVAEIAQRMALGKGVNATIRDRYFGAASAMPASVFPLLLRGMQNHLSKLRKDGKGGFVEKEMDQIAAMLPPALPRALRLEEQGRFVIGYYHQRQARIAGKPMAEKADEDMPEETSDE
ncbi:type I-C CRISPR-associated protein Cas8c/Csd1 [Pseudoroseomonas cervicalis]|uniref:type I-C CRISPR-associated protein Cas8c/Csd1 n=1 Tax=Teichococcus cervicalis TaxID=204525 RepID=UPI0022F16305|nr:type I-C CRISPR-associated protein Cas8c/Csd1 [Pseudoroseomonas cervicalis]WBV41605.1 type I-C CRISPR-associated protein Cas8c/Csd1 [Pseudoroseomonas cervicalis]